MTTTTSTPILIGVGGTGQAVLASYLRLSDMAGFPPAPFYIVDSDTKGPLGNKLTELRTAVRGFARGVAPAKRWQIDPFPIGDANRRTFGSLFGDLSGDRRELFDCLFSEAAEATKIRTGMYGRPAVGATCMRFKILGNDADLSELKDKLRGGDKHVILVGSCFGGTGSGGIPMLAKELRRLGDEPGHNLKVDAIVFLPWFRLVQPEGRFADEDRRLFEHLNQNFEPNAAAAINYFREELSQHLDTLLLLGATDPARSSRESREAEQVEVPHALNLLAAILAHQHFSGTLAPPEGIGGYWYDDATGLQPAELQIPRANGSSLTLHRTVQRTYLRQQALDLLAHLLRMFTQLPTSQEPPFLTAAVKRLCASVRRPEEVLEEAAGRLDLLHRVAQDELKWIVQMNDGVLFRMTENDAKVKDDGFERLMGNPLPTLQRWLAESTLRDSFERSDFESPALFADRLGERFVEHLTKRFGL